MKALDAAYEVLKAAMKINRLMCCALSIFLMLEIFAEDDSEFGEIVYIDTPESRIESDEDLGASKEIFSRVNDKLAVIVGSNVCGSGFIASFENGKKYLVTNKHIVDGTSIIDARLLSGKCIELGNFEYAENLDLVRFEVDGDSPSFVLNETTPVTGDDVYVFGNSGGAGVVTSIKGYVEGVGPDIVEVTAKFIQGNSGSPVVDKKGSVIGVASFILVPRYDLVSFDTRFNSLRRFAIRLGGAKWKRANLGEYLSIKQKEIIKERNAEKNERVALDMRSTLKSLEQVLNKADCIYTAQEVISIAKKRHIGNYWFKDYWGMDYEFNIVTNAVILRSAGADQLFNTYDDIAITNKNFYLANVSRRQAENAKREAALEYERELQWSRYWAAEFSRITGCSLDTRCNPKAFVTRRVDFGGSFYYILKGKEIPNIKIEKTVFNSPRTTVSCRSHMPLFQSITSDSAVSRHEFSEIVTFLRNEMCMSPRIDTNGFYACEFEFPDGRILNVTHQAFDFISTDGYVSISYQSKTLMDELLKTGHLTPFKELQPVLDVFLGIRLNCCLGDCVGMLKRGVNVGPDIIEAEFNPVQKFIDFENYYVRFKKSNGRIFSIGCQRDVMSENDKALGVAVKKALKVMKIIEYKYKREFYLIRDSPTTTTYIMDFAGNGTAKTDRWIFLFVDAISSNHVVIKVCACFSEDIALSEYEKLEKYSRAL